VTKEISTVSLTERYEAIAADMDHAAQLAEADDFRHPVTRFHAQRWAEELRALDDQLRGVVDENERLREGGLQLDGVIRRLVDENEELRAALDRLRGQ
jgi:hypothetical protein